MTVYSITCSQSSARAHYSSVVRENSPSTPPHPTCCILRRVSWCFARAPLRVGWKHGGHRQCVLVLLYWYRACIIGHECREFRPSTAHSAALNLALACTANMSLGSGDGGCFNLRKRLMALFFPAHSNMVYCSLRTIYFYRK